MKSKYEKSYIKADKYVVICDNDVDLEPVILSLPKPPPIRFIDGYGLPPEEQRFERIKIPRRLKDLEAEAIQITKDDISTNKNSVLTLLKIQKTFWSLMDDRSKELKKEIDFIRKVWWMRIYGQWIFIKGKPTWIPPMFFFYLNNFEMDTQSRRPEYRDCDRREYVFKNYCWTAHESFTKVDEHGYAIPEEDGSYLMTDLGRRICFGDLQPKNRRRGNTSKSISDMIEVVTRTIGTDGGGIQSFTEKSASQHFKGKVMPAWDALPIWFKPLSTSGRTSDTLRLETAKNDYGLEGLGTKMDYATTASSKYFDGQKRKYLLTDEEGKTSNVSVSERWGVNKHTLAQGDGMIISGYSSHPSTSNQLSDGAGDYEFLAKSSDFYRRIYSKGQTPSGLFRIFIPAQDGLEGFVDSYGYSVTGEIKEYQKKEGFKQTSEEFLSGERDMLLKENTPESMRKYREHKQLYPMCYADVWMGMHGDIGFDIEKIDNRLAELRRCNNTIRGNFEWKDGIVDGEVEFVEDGESGRFIVSKMPPDEVRNKKVKVSFFNAPDQKMEQHWRPMYPSMFTAGADPYRTGGKADEKIAKSMGRSSRLSDGGLTVLWNYDESIDGSKQMSDWDSYRFVVTYRYRHSNTKAFHEDALKMCVFYNAMMFPESNIPNTYEYFIERGYGAYLIYDIDKYSGVLKSKPGMDSLERSKQELFTLWRDYIDFRCHKEEHMDLLKELKDIKGIEFMRHFDLIASGGMALAGAKSSYVDRFSSNENEEPDLNDFYGW